MKPISCNQEIGDTGRLLCPEAPQDPAGYQNLRLGIRNFFLLSL